MSDHLRNELLEADAKRWAEESRRAKREERLRRIDKIVLEGYENKC